MKESAALLRVAAAMLSLVLTPLLMFVLGLYIVKWTGMEGSPIFAKGLPALLAALGLISAVRDTVRGIKKYGRVVDETPPQDKYK